MLLATLMVYLLVLLAIGFWAQRRTANSADFHLAGRQLGPWVAALSASTSSSSAWSLLGVSGAAYAWGLQAAWLAPAVIAGFVLNWYWIAPRLHRASHHNGALTLVEFLASDANTAKPQSITDGDLTDSGPSNGGPSNGHTTSGATATHHHAANHHSHHPLSARTNQEPAQGDSQPAAWQRWLRRWGAVIILFCFTFYIAAQFQAAGTAISAAVAISPALAVWTGAAVVLLYVLLGGFWAASVTDAVQGVLMAAVAVILPLAALFAVGGPLSLWQQLQALGQPQLLAIVQQPNALLSLLFIAGLCGIGLGYPGQPHVVNRFMAMRDGHAIAYARRIALLWAVVIYSGMIVLGWCGRVLLPQLLNREEVLLALSQQLLPAVVGGIVSGGVLAAIMSTADSQLLVAGAAVSHDFRPAQRSLGNERAIVLILGIAAVLIALYFPSTLFQRVLFAWQALGNAFGPLLLVLLWAGPVAGWYRLSAMLTGFSLTVALSFTPDTPGDALERLLPFCLALAISWYGYVINRDKA